MTIIHYKGYEIYPATQQLAETGEWTLRVSIVKHRDSLGESNDKLFDGSNTPLNSLRGLLMESNQV